MKKYTMPILGLVIFLSLPCLAQAKSFDWRGAQVQTAVHGDLPLVKDKLHLRGTVTWFWIPEHGVNFLFTYFGPKFMLTDWLWMSPQVGVNGGWVEDGSDALIISLWCGMAFFQGKLTIFLEGDGYLSKTQRDYYGYYSIDYNTADWFNVGLHVEQVNKLVMLGPHIGFSSGPWHGEIQYFAGFQEENYGHTVRFVTMLFF